ncbi:hypothetical protein V7201_02830 [Bacillus sp. JJ1122]|uniref:hypothetical protein n=1 Tax=Bacillus sp. JJ1122 TaxID=3122951 RepID=UPI00300091E2
MKKLRTSALSLLLLFTFLLTHGTLPAEKVKAFGTKTKAILLVDKAAEDLPEPDTSDKKAFTIFYPIVALLFIQSYISRRIPANAFTTFFAFLTAVFYQSNYVIKPLRF